MSTTNIATTGYKKAGKELKKCKEEAAKNGSNRGESSSKLTVTSERTELKEKRSLKFKGIQLQRPSAYWLEGSSDPRKG